MAQVICREAGKQLACLKYCSRSEDGAKEESTFLPGTKVPSLSVPINKAQSLLYICNLDTTMKLKNHEAN